MEQKQAFEMINKLSFFDNFTQEEKHSISTFDNQIWSFNSNDVIIKEGDLDNSFFILLKGLVTVIKSNSNDMVLTTLKAGAVFGEISCILKRVRTTTVVADGNAIALKIDTQNMDKLKPNISSKLKDKLIEVLVKRLETINSGDHQNL